VDRRNWRAATTHEIRNVQRRKKKLKCTKDKYKSLSTVMRIYDQQLTARKILVVDKQHNSGHDEEKQNEIKSSIEAPSFSEQSHTTL
jgi:hypothetical protein